jgi:hypothetical protein
MLNPNPNPFPVIQVNSILPYKLNKYVSTIVVFYHTVLKEFVLFTECKTCIWQNDVKKDY